MSLWFYKGGNPIGAKWGRKISWQAQNSKIAKLKHEINGKNDEIIDQDQFVETRTG